MKLQQLTEAIEILDRSAYGYWIDPENHPHPVPYGGHADWVSKNIVRNLSPEEQERMRDLLTYEKAFTLGYVRTEHSDPERVVVEGVDKDIRRTLPIIMATAVQPDLFSLAVDVRGKDLRKTGTGKLFWLPRERSKLMKFLRGL